MSQFRKRWREPSFILDIAQVIVAAAVAIVLALDMTGIWAGIPWLSNTQILRKIWGVSNDL